MAEMVHVDHDPAPPERKRTAVYRHPDRDKIEALLIRGKTGWWVAEWLAELYPSDDDVEDRRERKRNEALALSDDLLDAYRRDWLPEATPGVDIVVAEIEDVIGRRFPGSTRGKEFELELLQMGVDAAQYILAQSLESDAKLNMGVSEGTMNAHENMMKSVKTSVELKQQLGVEGYEPLMVPQHHIHEGTTTKNVNVHLHGRRDPHTGQMGPTEPDRVSAVLALINASEGRADEILDSTASEVSGADPGPNPAEP